MPSKATGTYKKLDLTYEPTTLDLEFWPIKAKRLLCPQAILLNLPITIDQSISLEVKSFILFK